MKPEIDWNSLNRQALPPGQHPKIWPVWGIPRHDGREVDLVGGEMGGAQHVLGAACVVYASDLGFRRSAKKHFLLL